MKLGKYSFGIGDRFAHQGEAQLSAIIKAKEHGVNITPVWNKSYREHEIIGSRPEDTRKAADIAVQNCNWTDAYFTDADHIGLKTVDYFIDSCDFYTLDVADFIGKTASEEAIETFCSNNEKYVRSLVLPLINETVSVSKQMIHDCAVKYLYAVEEAAKIYDHVKNMREGKTSIIEVSMDETDEPQTPIELFFILSAIAQKSIPIQTIAPKFSGSFFKGIDYIGDVELFEKEFEQDVAVLNLAIQEFKLDPALKLSVHSGSDKFSIYGCIGKTLKKFDAGLHIKTAGTTWLEELIGLAEAGSEGLKLAKDIYTEAYSRYDELAAPYAAVIGIDKNQLPTADEVQSWDSQKYTASLRHDQSNTHYNSNFRQLLHIGYKIAVKKGTIFTNALIQHKEIIARNVSENIFERHIKPIFLNL